MTDRCRIEIRIKRDEKAAAEAAAAKRGKTLSELIRAHLARIAKADTRAQQ